MIYISNVIIALTILYFCSNFLQLVLNSIKSNIEDQIKEKKILEEKYRKIKEEHDRNRIYNSINIKYSKWNKLDHTVKSKILKVKALAERGEDGEKSSAKNKLNIMLKKNNITLSDIP